MSGHPEPPGEPCVLCGDQATHKIGEDGPFFLHNMTNYVCCRCMRRLGMDCSTYPYEAAMTNPFPFPFPVEQ